MSNIPASAMVAGYAVAVFMITLFMWFIKKAISDQGVTYKNSINDLKDYYDNRFKDFEDKTEKANDKVLMALDSVKSQQAALSTKVAQDYVHGNRFDKHEEKDLDFQRKVDDSLTRMHNERETGDSKLYERINEVEKDLKDKLSGLEKEVSGMSQKCAARHGGEKAKY